MTAFSLVSPDPVSTLAEPGALRFALERPQDAPLVEDLVDRAFGPGRFAKTAERLREGGRMRSDLSICAWDGDQLAGAARQWSVLIGDASAVFLGPFAVDAGWRSRGLGGELIRRGCAAAEAAGEGLVLLVGDRAYFGPLGFEPVEPGRVIMPGPVDPRRILWRVFRPEALDEATGPVRIPPSR